MKRLACLGLAGLVALAVVAPSSGSSPAGGWKLTNLVKVARHRFPAYVGIQPVRLASDGTVYWTAYQQHSDPRTVDVFSWKNNRLRDLGSPGPGLAVAAANDRGQFAVFTAPLPCPLRGCSGPPPPPTHGYLWEPGKLVDLGSLGGANTGPAAINDRGQIAGSSQVAEDDRAPFHAFVWQNGKMRDLGTLGGTFSGATAISERGQVIGTSSARGRAIRGFVWDRGKMTDLGTLGGGDVTPGAVNDRGEVIGVSADRGFLWQRGRMTPLGKLDLSGYALVCHGSLATSCAPRCPGTKCGLWGSVPRALDDRGEVVGITQTNVGLGRAFLWRNGKISDLGTLGGRSSEALATSDEGTIVGWSDTKLVPYSAEYAPRARPVVWQNGHMVELPVDYASPSRASAITPSGDVILGAGGYPPHQAFVWTRR